MSLEQKQKIYFSRLSSWAPGLQSHADWLDWASGKKKILLDSSAPKLEFTPALFRRRLSQLSKMTIQVIHDSLLLGKDESGREIFEDLKIFFTSFRGEIKREFTINEELIKEGDVLPASFSLSVFNAPVALSSIAFSLKNGYSVVFPSKENFNSAFLAATSSLLCKRESKILFVYADELIPEEYGIENKSPFAFATVMSLACEKDSFFHLSVEEINSFSKPEEMLSKLILSDS